MSKTAKDILADIRARRTSLESEARALRRVEAALRAQHRPAPARRKKAKR